MPPRRILIRTPKEKYVITVKFGADRRRDFAFVLLTAVLSAILALIPSPFAGRYVQAGSERARARILETDNALVKQVGIVKEGSQALRIRIESGRFRGREFESSNNLIGKMELDKMFVPGDKAFVVLDLTKDRKDVAYANVIDHYRIDWTILLVALFAVGVVAFAGWIGVKALLSFVFAGVVLLKVLIPLMLKDWDPIWTTLGIVAILTANIQFLVGGFSRKGAVAFLGAISGVAATCGLSVLFTRLLHIHGAVRPFTETLLYSGYAHLDLSKLFMAGVFLASSGAVMDLAMDIAAAQAEIREKNPDIGRLELVRSGVSVGRHVIGTMTTTLLLAYSGGYMGTLMTFIGQGVPTQNVLNLIYVSAELVHTMVGSFGLVLVAPLTAIVGGIVMGAPEPSVS